MKKGIMMLCVVFLLSCGTQGGGTRVSGDPIAILDKKIEYYGGDGSLISNPVIIKNALNSLEGIDAEMAYISYLNGQQDRDWISIGTSTFFVDKKVYDLVEYQILPDKTTKQIYFDVTEFYGKF